MEANAHVIRTAPEASRTACAVAADGAAWPPPGTGRRPPPAYPPFAPHSATECCAPGPDLRGKRRAPQQRASRASALSPNGRGSGSSAVRPRVPVASTQSDGADREGACHQCQYGGALNRSAATPQAPSIPFAAANVTTSVASLVLPMPGSPWHSTNCGLPRSAAVRLHRVRRVPAPDRQARIHRPPRRPQCPATSGPDPGVGSESRCVAGR